MTSNYNKIQIKMSQNFDLQTLQTKLILKWF